MQSANVKVRIKGTKVYVEQMRADAFSGGGGTPAYDAASMAPRLSQWLTNNGGPNSTITGSLDTIRRRSRDMVRKNGLADGGIEKLVDHFIGTGIVPQFRTKDAAFNGVLQELWRRWTDEADTTGDYDFYGLEALACRSMLEAGEVFTRMRPRRNEDVRTVPLQLQMLESEFCPVEKNEGVGEASMILSGIEVDALDRKVAYWMYRQHPHDLTYAARGLGFPLRVPASEVCHMKMVRRPGMLRGEPWLTRALIKLYDLDKYDDAQLVRQQIAAMFVAFLRPNAQGLMTLTDNPDEQGLALGTLEPGTGQVLPPGSDMTFSNPPSVGDSYTSFNKQQHQYIASALGVLYEQLTGDYSSGNDRTWRAAFSDFKRKIRRHQHHMIVYQWCRPILRRWAELGVISGKIKLPAGITVDDVALAEWVPQAWDYINPVQDIQAQREEVRAGFASRRQKINERGDSIEQIDADNASDNARTDDAGVIYDTNAKHVSMAGVTQARPGGTGFASPDEPVPVVPGANPAPFGG
jgi:lambda family phage portal protein